MADREQGAEEQETIRESTDLGEGQRGGAGGRERGTFAPTPTEMGDAPADEPGGPDIVPPHRQPG